jgi:hypothetical protein
MSLIVYGEFSFSRQGKFFRGQGITGFASHFHQFVLQKRARTLVFIVFTSGSLSGSLSGLLSGLLSGSLSSLPDRSPAHRLTAGLLSGLLSSLPDRSLAHRLTAGLLSSLPNRSLARLFPDTLIPTQLPKIDDVFLGHSEGRTALFVFPATRVAG